MKFASNLTPKTFFILSGVVVALGAGLCYLSMTSNGEQQKVLEGLRKDLRNEAEVQKELSAAKLKVEGLRNKLVHLENGVPTFAYVPTLLKELESFGKKSKVQILTVKPIIGAPSQKKEGDRKKPYEELAINVKARGTYVDAARFIQALKVFPKIVAIRTLSIMPKQDMGNGEDGKPPILEIDIELKAFAYKDAPKTAQRDEAETDGGNS